jgi:hypothetical protein
MYSRLDFSRIEDRPIAIKGLEDRLQRAYKTTGDYGIFGHDPDGGLFHRSLLWCRGKKEERMARIKFPEDRKIVPSWSWMAYKGGIDYLDPPFRAVNWETKDISPPWPSSKESEQPNGSGGGPARQDEGVELTGMMRGFFHRRAGPLTAELVYDDSAHVPLDGMQQCVVVAKAKAGSSDDEKDHYVLIVEPCVQAAADKGNTYRRVGVGKLPGKCILLGGEGTRVKIC